MAHALLSVCLLLLASCQAQVLLRKRDLTVNVGRDVFLRSDDLVFRRTRRGEECRVEVVTTDPVTQRVGHVHPTVSPLCVTSCAGFIRAFGLCGFFYLASCAAFERFGIFR